MCLCPVSYELPLPSDLPPSHRGKSIRFNYNLIISTQRGTPNRPSHTVQLPFRVFNHISGTHFFHVDCEDCCYLVDPHASIEDGSRPIYDLMNPVVMYRDEAVVKAVEDASVVARDDSGEHGFKIIISRIDNLKSIFRHDSITEGIHAICGRVD